MLKPSSFEILGPRVFNVNFVNTNTKEENNDASLNYTDDLVNGKSTGLSDDDSGGRPTQSSSMDAYLEL